MAGGGALHTRALMVHTTTHIEAVRRFFHATVVTDESRPSLWQVRVGT